MVIIPAANVQVKHVQQNAQAEKLVYKSFEAVFDGKVMNIKYHLYQNIIVVPIGLPASQSIREKKKKPSPRNFGFSESFLQVRFYEPHFKRAKRNF